MATWDPLKLAVLGRKYSYYPRPSQLDTYLNGLIGFGFIVALASTFVVAILVSYLGTELKSDIVGQAVATVAVFSVYVLVWTFFVSSVPLPARALILVPGTVIVVTIPILAFVGVLNHWLLYMPLFIYASVLSLVCAAQIAFLNGRWDPNSRRKDSAA